MNNIFVRLFITFFKIGAFTFGGGWAMISIIEKEIVDKNHWIEREDFLDLLAVAQSLPGILAVNISVAVGDKLRGIKGSLAAALGTILPSFMIILCIAKFHTTARTAKIGWKTIAIPVVVALLIWSRLPIISNPIIYIVLGGFFGWLWLSKHHKELQKIEEDIRKEDEKL